MSGRILIVDDVATNRAVLGSRLSAAFYDVATAASGEEALETARRDPPDLALLDVMMPGMDGYELCRRFKTDPELADAPVVMVTALDAPAERVRGLEAGADDFLTKPVDELALFARVRSLLRTKAMTDELRLRDATCRDLGLAEGPRPEITPPPGAEVLTLASAEVVEELRDALETRLDVTIRRAPDGRALLDAAAARPPQAIIIDALALDGDPSALCSALRHRAESRGAAILLLVGAKDSGAAAAGLDAGANDYVMRPLDPSELAARLRAQLRHKAYSDHLRTSLHDGLRMAVTDPLTGLRNRRYVDAHLDRMLAQARAAHAPLAALALDLDRFKAVNDRYGHAAGDAVLVEFARRLGLNTRGVDLIARLGGEEFLVAMPDADLPDALAAAERIRSAVATPLFDAGDARLSITVSIGVATLRGEDAAAADLLSRADAALYAAKEGGRNRVTLEAA